MFNKSVQDRTVEFETVYPQALSLYFLTSIRFRIGSIVGHLTAVIHRFVVYFVNYIESLYDGA